MKSRLKTNLILMQIVFLLIVVGGSAVVYSIFAAPYYTREKAKAVLEAFEDIRETDMEELDSDAFRMLSSYEEEHLSFTIADENYQPIYTTSRNDPADTVRRNIRNNLERFSDNPQVLQRSSRNYEGTRLLGSFRQNGITYYVCVKETSGSSYSTIFYTEHFLVAVVIVAVFLGSLVMYVFSRRIARPIENMAVVSKRMAEHDFSARVKEETPYREVNELAKNFNDMADQLQYYIQELEKNNAELGNANERLQEQNEQKIKLEKMRQEFSANISHELKTPLAVISSQVDMVQMLNTEEERAYYFASIQEEIEKMSDMIRRLLKISAAEHELEKLDRNPVNLAEEAEYLMMKYDALFRQKEIRRSCRVEQDCIVWADRSCMEQVMSNYLLNAFAHTGAGGRIDIALERKPDGVVFRVYNEGEQIGQQEQEKIWEHYYQGERRENHAGLGLYIVKTIVVLHDGAYGVKNKKGGVEFWFSLPVYREKKESC